MRKRIAALVGLLLLAGQASAQTASASLGRFTLSAEGLLWWFRKSPAPVPIVVNGPLADPGTQVLLGGREIGTNTMRGVRLTSGYAIGSRLGVEGGFLHLPRRSASRSVTSTGELDSVNLLLPYIDVLGQEATREISLPSVHGGAAREELKTGLTGAEVNVTWALPASGGVRLVALAGARWLRMRETYTITTSRDLLGVPGDIWTTADEFDARNDFGGLQVGLRGRYDERRFYLTGLVKVALGEMRQRVDVDGFLVTNTFGTVETFAGGYFALPSSIGSHRRAVLAVVPEVAFDYGYQITPRATVFLGYTALYTNKLVRATGQVDRHLNTTQSVSWVGSTELQPEGPPRPSVPMESRAFWAQGIHLGLGYRF